jgi:hypothetical protein
MKAKGREGEKGVKKRVWTQPPLQSWWVERCVKGVEMQMEREREIDDETDRQRGKRRIKNIRVKGVWKKHRVG